MDDFLRVNTNICRCVKRESDADTYASVHMLNE